MYLVVWHHYILQSNLPRRQSMCITRPQESTYIFLSFEISWEIEIIIHLQETSRNTSFVLMVSEYITVFPFSLHVDNGRSSKAACREQHNNCRKWAIWRGSIVCLKLYQGKVEHKLCLIFKYIHRHRHTHTDTHTDTDTHTHTHTHTHTYNWS